MGTTFIFDHTCQGFGLCDSECFRWDNWTLVSTSYSYTYVMSPVMTCFNISASLLITLSNSWATSVCYSKIQYVWHKICCHISYPKHLKKTWHEPINWFTNFSDSYSVIVHNHLFHFFCFYWLFRCWGVHNIRCH